MSEAEPVRAGRRGMGEAGIATVAGDAGHSSDTAAFMDCATESIKLVVLEALGGRREQADSSDFCD